MSENTTISEDLIDGQIDLLTGEAVEVTPEDTELTVEDVVRELTGTVFGESETITPYKVSVIVNGAFEALGIDKKIPPQMMYNYSRNGLLVKGQKGIKALNKEQVETFATKYVTKYTK